METWCAKCSDEMQKKRRFSEASFAKFCRPSASLLQARADLGRGRAHVGVVVGAEKADGGEADHDDEREHHQIFQGGSPPAAARRRQLDLIAVVRFAASQKGHDPGSCSWNV